MTLVTPRIQPYLKAYLPINVQGHGLVNHWVCLNRFEVGCHHEKLKKTHMMRIRDPEKMWAMIRNIPGALAAGKSHWNGPCYRTKEMIWQERGPWLSVITCPMPQECHENNKKQGVAFQMTCQGSTTKSCCCFIASMRLYLSDWSDLDN